MIKKFNIFNFYNIDKTTIILADYDGTLPPKNTINGKISLTPLPVDFQIEIISFDNIDSLNMKIT